MASSSERLHRRAREQLVASLQQKGITHKGVLQAIGTVPRHRFVDQALHGRAYNDEALPIGSKQTISQPYTVAYQSMLLDPQLNDRILEVGTGSGYQSAVLCEMGVRVFTVERHKELLQRAKKMLSELGCRVVAKCDDGSQGWLTFAPYDGILVTAGAKEVPQPLLEQLRVPDKEHRGGRLIIPVGPRSAQTMLRITRTGADTYDTEEHTEFRFVPLVSGDKGKEQ